MFNLVMTFLISYYQSNIISADLLESFFLKSTFTLNSMQKNLS